MHETVLLKEAVKALVTRPAGSYIDGTFGRGGHSAEILRNLSKDGNLLAVDRDPEAIVSATKLARADCRLQVFHGLFSELPIRINSYSVKDIDGILLDLGVSSPQLDDANRGFSFLKSVLFMFQPTTEPTTLVRFDDLQ